MNLSALLSESWRITRTSWSLWVLSALVVLALVPALLLAGGLGGAAAMLALPSPGGEPAFLEQLRNLPGWAWALAWLAALLLLVATSAVTYLLQAGVLHGVTIAAERATPPSLGEALNLGRERFFRILRFSLTFGASLTALSLLPVLARLMLASQLDPGSNAVLALGQSSFSLLLSGAGLALFLMFMTIAVEDVSVRRAPRRTWAVFRKGWWAFLLILALSTIPALALALLLLPVFVLIPIVALSPELGAVLLGLCCLLAGPVGLGLFLFIAVYTNALYTLVYRAAARLADATSGPPPA